MVTTGNLTDIFNDSLLQDFQHEFIYVHVRCLSFTMGFPAEKLQSYLACVGLSARSAAGRSSVI